MDKNTVVIAIDHGWSNMKTVHETFTSGIREITTEPALFENVLEKDGKYYKVGSERLKVKDSKVEDENYYLLSLAATAKELDRLGKRTANVYWAVGLPLTRFGKEKKKEDRQLRYINQYADAHGLIPMKIVRKSCFAPYVVNQMYSRCIDWMQQGKAEAILVANMEYLALDEEDAYRKVGQVRKAGFRIFSVDDGELKMNIRFRAEKERKIG